MRIDTGLDTGPMLLKKEVAIGPDETAPELSARLAEIGTPLIAETLRILDRGEITPTPQDNSQASHAPPLKKEDGRIDWELPAEKIYNRVRGLQPWPGTFTTFRGKSCHIWAKPAQQVVTGGESGSLLVTDDEGLLVNCGAGVLHVAHVQMEGRKRVTGIEFANGARLKPGEKFGS
jgi:methionyl-tRNA formyltransferase